LLASMPNPQEYNDTVIWPDKVRLNLLYLKNKSFWLDIKICYYTFNTTDLVVEKLL
jgi:lipopolysaccharide/colanic/teichoic acid biosynthesis glycosyltransferase